MELIPINESKIKIMLNESDMKAYNIGDEADCANRETRIAIRNILDRAKEQIGFNTEGSEIFVQLYTSKNGGCELFVTKGSDSSAERDKVHTEHQKPIRKRAKRDLSVDEYDKECLALSVRDKLLPSNKDKQQIKMVFSFESLDNLCAASKRISKLPKQYESAVYRGYGDDYYLLLTSLDLSAYSRLDPIALISEYGKRERGDIFSMYLGEHCKKICESGAIETFSRL